MSDFARVRELVVRNLRQTIKSSLASERYWEEYWRGFIDATAMYNQITVKEQMELHDLIGETLARSELQGGEG